MKKILNGQNIRIITNQTKPMSIKQQQEPKESFVVVNKNPTSTKKKAKLPLHVYYGLCDSLQRGSTTAILTEWGDYGVFRSKLK